MAVLSNAWLAGKLRRWLGMPPAAASRSVPFSGAQIGRLTATLPSFSQSINADLDGSLVILRSRARNLCANHEYGRRFLSMVATNVVGAYGPTLQVRAYNMPMGKGTATLDKPANAAIEAHWKRWGKRCDIAGRLTLPQLLRVAMKSVARDGEVLVRPVRRRDLPYGIALQLLEADRLDEGLNRTLANGNIVRQGVEIDPLMCVAAYYVRANHPGDRYSQPKNDIERVPASEMFHLFLPERAEQVRGYTWMHAVLMRAQMLQGYEEAALVAARVGASKMGVFTTGADGDGNPLNDVADEQADGGLHMSAEPGEFIDLRGHPGTTLESWNPEYPRGEFGSFVQQCLRGIAAGLDVDYATLANDLTSVNYSSIRAGTIETRETWIMLQEWLIDSFLLPLYRQWLASALPMGSITFDSGSRLPAERLEKFADAGLFVGRRWPWVDPLKDAQASKELISAGLSSRTEIAASQGRDFADIVDELAAEREMLEAAGLPTGDAPTPAAPAEPPPPSEDEMEDKRLRERRVAALEQAVAKTHVINVMPAAAPSVTVERTEVRVDGAVVNVAPPVVNVAAPEVNLEATLPELRAPESAPVVVNVAPADVTVNVEPTLEATLQQKDSVTTHERNAAGDLVKSTTTYS
jgi:lambda family phage portal protein